MEPQYFYSNTVLIWSILVTYFYLRYFYFKLFYASVPQQLSQIFYLLHIWHIILLLHKNDLLIRSTTNQPSNTKASEIVSWESSSVFELNEQKSTWKLKKFLKSQSLCLGLWRRSSWKKVAESSKASAKQSHQHHHHHHRRHKNKD